jgi:hypothetical protein
MTATPDQKHVRPHNRKLSGEQQGGNRCYSQDRQDHVAPFDGHAGEPALIGLLNRR